jgi:Ca2+-binding RTX toxin-like protein
MSSSRPLRCAAALTAGLGALVFAGSAAAQSSNPFGCRASVTATRLTSPLPTVEPYVANRPTTPCATDSAGASPGTVSDGPSNDTTLAGPAGAYTFSTSSADTTAGPVARGATALASNDGGTINNPGNSIVLVGPAEAQATYGCTGGAIQATGSSDVNAININGQSYSPSSPGAEETIPLGGGSSVTINQKVQTPTSLIERLVDVHIAGVGDQVLGEAEVTLTSADPCAGTSGSGGGGGSGSGSGGGGGSGSGGSGSDGGVGTTLNACPAGSTLIAGTQMCEIVVPGGADIVVSRPFEGPTGGTVISLGDARKTYHSACLSGPGANYAIVGTPGANRIEGTTHGDRILALGGRDRVAGRGGDDCIDGGAGNDRVWGGKGKHRVYGGPGSDRLSVQNGSSSVWGGRGNDRIFVGNGSDDVSGGAGNDRIAVGRGTDRIAGGAGNDTISTGDGNDSVRGQSGTDRLYVGNGKDHISGGPGNDRLYGSGVSVWERGGTGHDIAYVSTFGTHYAHRHGCETVRKIHIHNL